MSCSGKCNQLTPTFDDYEEYLKDYLRNSSKLAILLDYDGTLAPNPKLQVFAPIPPETRCVLQRLYLIPGIYLAVITGRKADNAKELVGIETITYAGCHGLEVLYPDGTTYVHQLPTDFHDQMSQLINKLDENFAKEGTWIHNKGISITFHFNTVPDNLQTTIEQAAIKVIDEENFNITKARGSLEVGPKVNWNKGNVALLILNKEFGEKWTENVKVIYVGDDTTDEDAMLALKGNAATFRIASSVDIKTHAVKLISSLDVVLKMLKFIEKIFRNC